MDRKMSRKRAARYHVDTVASLELCRCEKCRGLWLVPALAASHRYAFSSTLGCPCCSTESLAGCLAHLLLGTILLARSA